MNRETRYAILIGINDYNDSPLDYCVNDADDFAKTLVDYCMFEEKNIFKLTSNNEKSLKDVTGQYLSEIRKIKESFKENIDSILFYFAGHGSQYNNQSDLWFQDSAYPIEDVFKDICSLKPKVQTYIIDACQSGNKVLTRNAGANISKFIHEAEGVSLLYACRSMELAQERPELSHGLLTHNLLSCIKEPSCYDNDGYLTFNGIVDFVQKHTSEDSGFEQIPVLESRISGFYPFAILKDKISDNRYLPISQCNVRTETKDLRELRTEIQSKCKVLVDADINSLRFSDYDINELDDLELLDSLDIKNGRLLKEEIVKYVENNNLVSLNKLIFQEEVEVDYKNNLFSSLMLSIDKMYNRPKVYINYVIDWHSNGLYSKFKNYLSSNIEEVSFGCGYIFYQAKWGAVLLYIAYLIDWDGEEDSQITKIKIKHISIPLKQNSLEILDNYSLDLENFISPLVLKWNDARYEELKAFETDNFIK